MKKLIKIPPFSRADKSAEKNIELRIASHISTIDFSISNRWTIKLMDTSMPKDDKIMRSAQLQIKYIGDYSLGMINDKIQIFPIDLNNHKLPPYDLDIESEIVSNYIISPRELHFGRIGIGSHAEEKITIHSITNTKISDITIVSCPSWIIVKPIDLHDSSERSYKIACHPESASNYSGSIAFNIIESPDKIIPIHLVVSATGVSSGESK